MLQPALRRGLEAAGLYVTFSELHALLGHAFDDAGQPDSARTHYRWALDAWEHADPEFEPRRQALRLRISNLER